MTTTHVSNMTYGEWANLRVRYTNSSTTLNDVAIVRLPRAASGSGIGLIAMVSANIGDMIGAHVQASGFGHTSTNGQFSPNILKADLCATLSRNR